MMQKIVRYHAHIKNKQTARNYSLLIFLRFSGVRFVLKIHGKLINQDSACCADDQDP